MNHYALMVLAQETEHVAKETKSWIWPEIYEITFGGFAIVLVFGLLIWKAGPFLKKGMNARTARIQKQIDDSTAARTNADAEAARIRQAKGDIGAERARLLADADTQAAQLLADGRSRLETEVAELMAKAETDNAQLLSRSGDELRAEIGRLAADATERVVSASLDDATQQELIERYIARVGASRA
jgi:F-type H+-transporting ATPase subunit b